MTKMTIEEAYEKSRLAKAVEEAKLGHVFLQNQNAVMIHDTDYTSEAKTDAEKAEMRDWVKQIMEKASARSQRACRSERRCAGQQVLLHIGDLRGRARRVDSRLTNARKEP